MLLLHGSLCTLLSGVILTFTVRAVARRIGAVAEPRRDRWHRQPTAMLGGIAIYAAFMAGYLIFTPPLSRAYPLVAGGTILFGIGLVDDALRIKPYTKLIVQVMAAALLVYCGLHLPWTTYRAIDDVITIFWLVGITNAVNLLDNMDGLAASVALLSCVFLAMTFVLSGQTAEAMLPVLLGSAILGFLAFNFKPASIFMGDCGSLFLGFMLGGMGLLSDYGGLPNLTSVLLTPTLIMMLPIFDTCMVTVTRKRSGRPISQGGRDHTSHRLVALGMSERRAVIMLSLFAALSGTLALLMRWLQAELVLFLLPGFALMVLFLGLYLARVRLYEGREDVPDSTIVQGFADFSYKRRICEVLLDVVLVGLAYYGAYVLRWDANIPGEQWAIFIRTLPLVIVVQMFWLLVCGVYRGLWRYVGIDDLMVIAKSVLLGAVSSAVVVLWMYAFRGPSRAVFVLYMLLLVVFVGTSRLSFRLLRAFLVGHAGAAHVTTPILIYGAGDRGQRLIRELLDNPNHHYVAVGFIDDDGDKAGQLILGHPIFGPRELPELIRRHGVREVILASETIQESRLDELHERGVRFTRLRVEIE